MAVAAAVDLREGGQWTRRQRLKNDAVYAVVRIALAVAKVLPRGAIAAACALLGVAAYLSLASARRAVSTRLARGLGRPSAARDVLAAFLGAGAVLADTIALLDPREDARRTLTIDDHDRALLRGAVEEGRGVVYVTAHHGPWERMAAVLVAEGFAVSAIARESYDPRLTALYEAIRAPRGVRAIYRGRPGAVAATLRALAAGDVVGFLVDVPARVPSVDVPLFGTTSPVPIGPARIALSRGAAVIVGTPERCRTGQARYQIRLRRVRTDDLGRGHEDAVLLTRRLADELGARIARDPAHWLGALAPLRETRATTDA